MSFTPRFTTSLFFLCYGLLVVVGWARCTPERHSDSPERTQAFEVALRWNRCLLELDRASEGYRPPVSARMFAYTGLAAWESALPGLPEAHSCTYLLPELKLPKWTGDQPFVLPAALNAAYASSAERFFPHTAQPRRSVCMHLQVEIEKELEGKYPPTAIEVSRAYGEAVAEAIFRWSATDSIGHQAFLFNYDRNYQPPGRPGAWQPSVFDQMPALLPFWGQARTFVTHVSDLKPQPPVAFSETHGSPFFAQALEVYNISQPLSNENRWIAEFWSDDFPGVTFSAASRWISVTNQALEQARPGCAVALEVWLKMGLGLNDAAVNTWHTKYLYNLERPESYVRRNISTTWQPLHHSPPFPAYPSGHAIFGGTSAEILTSLLGDNFEITDRSHEGRREFLGKPRSYHSFAEMAAENAISRLYIGVHYRMDCEEGLRLGKIVGSRVAALQLRDPAAVKN